MAAMVLKFANAEGFFNISRFCWILEAASLHHTWMNRNIDMGYGKIVRQYIKR